MIPPHGTGIALNISQIFSSIDRRFIDMSKKSNFWNGFSKYFMTVVMGLFMLYAVSAAYIRTASSGQELDSGTSGAVSASGPSVPDPYNPELKDIFFDRDSYVIRGDAKPVLAENAQALKSEPGTYVVIESYCDAREESPSSLGIRRADAVKEYILSRGVDAEQILTVNKCTVYDMQLVERIETVRLDSRVHFVALDQPVDRDRLASAR
jgi:hypothetical protein